MKHYKVVWEDEYFEETINEYAKEGYEVFAFQLCDIPYKHQYALMVKEETSAEKAEIRCKQCPYFNKEDEWASSYCGLKHWVTKEDNKCLCPKDLEEAVKRSQEEIERRIHLI